MNRDLCYVIFCKLEFAAVENPFEDAFLGWLKRSDYTKKHWDGVHQSRLSRLRVY